MARFFPELQSIDTDNIKEPSPFRVGDTVKVHYRIREGEKERVQVFQGVVIRKSGGGVGATFCVRKRSGGVGVERIFPVYSPRIEKVDVVSSGRVRRSRLYFLRMLSGKKARLREERRDV
jgi:large subunit ribosomal protein L19